MPALLGYLIALTVLLGGGYAGLEWLSSPDDAIAYQHPKATTPAANKHVEPKKSVPATDAIIQAENAAPETTAQAGNAGHDEAQAIDASAEKLKTQQVDAVPTGGCMPIGLTASGQMVFPLQCRELLEAGRGAVVSSVPEQKAPGQSGDGAQGSKEPGGTGGAPITSSRNEEPPTNSSPASESAPVEKDAESIDSASTKTAPQNEIAQKQLVQREASQATSDDVAPTNAVKAAVRRSSGEIKTQKPEKSKSATDRSRLVKMTLLTIEFPDGHREQRLVPYRRVRNALARDDD